MGKILDALNEMKGKVIAEDEKIITLLQAESAQLADISAKLAAALADEDLPAVQAVIDEVNAETEKTDAAVTAAQAALPPAL